MTKRKHRRRALSLTEAGPTSQQAKQLRLRHIGDDDVTVVIYVVWQTCDPPSAAIIAGATQTTCVRTRVITNTLAACSAKLVC